jgi:teichoic acid transport system ATP-binding protein
VADVREQEAVESMQAGSTAMALAVVDVHVTYRVYEQRRTGLRDVFTRGFKPRAYRSIEAVRGVSFAASVGEVIGVIGSNGSGKSTLLRSVAGMLPPSSGEVYARSQPMLLGVGAALKPGLSGRRNIMIGGLALGMSRDEVSGHEQSIIDFAGLQDFIDLPMEAYSSGMKARLHFAIATAVSPEILLIDEALAVGDKDFRRRSAARIREIREQAGTVFLVSHNLHEIRGSCSRTLWMEHGQVVMDGATDEVIAAYTADDPADEPSD